VNEACSKARGTLETGGLHGRSEIRSHLDECPACRAHAALLSTLAKLEPGEADPVTVRRIMATLPPVPWQKRRLAAWLPLGAGFAFVAAGLLLLGGVPAAGTVAQLPAAARGVLGWIASSALDALTAARGGSDAAQGTDRGRRLLVRCLVGFGRARRQLGNGLPHRTGAARNGQ